MKTCEQVRLLGVRVENAPKGVRDSPGAFECHQATVREGKKGSLWQGPALSLWLTWSPRRVAHSLFVRMLRHQENMKFLNLL